MAAILKEGVELYNYLNEDLADPRTKDWFLASSPWMVLALVGFYLYFCLSAGPKFMKNRPAYNVDKLIVVYDLFQIAICGWMTFQGFLYFYPGRYKFFCEPIDYSTDEIALRAVELCWVYFVLKIMDLLDTVFFVLRKKNSQISFLHVYHHAIMVLGIHYGLRHTAGGHFILLGHVNSFVHTVMYTYYLLTNVNPEYKKSLWWKKYITQLQIAQFLMLFVQNFPTLFWEDCDVSYGVRVFLSLQNFFMVMMFADFYRKAYLSKKVAE